MRRFSALLTAALFVLLSLAAIGCDDVEPVLAGTPTPTASPTPIPDAFSAEITAEPMPTDPLGNPFEGEDHYLQYLSFGDMRVYEYENGTFLDGVCVNAYPEALDGTIDIVYYDGDGRLCGIGTIHNASGGTVLETGANPIYAEIRTDINVCEMDFVWEVKRSFQPLPGETPTP